MNAMSSNTTTRRGSLIGYARTHGLVGGLTAILLLLAVGKSHAVDAEAMYIGPEGNVGVGTERPVAPLDVQQAPRSGSHPATVDGFYVTGPFAEDRGVEFRHDNATQGIGFGYNTIYATGTNQNQDLNLKPRGNGEVKVRSGLDVSGELSGAPVAQIQNMIDRLIPAGTILAYGGDTKDPKVVKQLADDGWLVCDGGGLKNWVYIELFHAIGYAYGGLGETFKLPDLRGRFLRGVDQGARRDPDAEKRAPSDAGGNTGDRVGSVQDDMLKSHTHRERHLGDHNKGGMAGGGYWADPYDDSGATGGDETRPKNLYVNFIIKAGRISR